MNAEQAKKLREPFPADLVGKLPKPTKRDNPKGRCRECGGWHGLPAVHLDYVGHAAVTDRLLSVDPDWSWEPMARDEAGQPILAQNQGGLGDEPLGLWGSLTVCGVTKPAFGGGKNAKECISDLIRNGAMRFGVGLDLWSKEDLHVEDEKNAGENRDTPAPSPEPVAAAAQAPSPTEQTVAERWNRLTLAEAKAKPAQINDGDLLRELLIVEGERAGGQRATVLKAISKRIQELEGDPEADPDPAVAQGGMAQVAQAENGASLNAAVAEPAEPLQELLACLAFIAEQPEAVDNASFWTPVNVLVGIANSDGGSYGTLAEVPEEWLLRVLGKVPAEVREMVARMGPEAQAKLIGAPA